MSSRDSAASSTESTDAACRGGSDNRHCTESTKNSALPTDSMVTVRLSKSSLDSTPDPLPKEDIECLETLPDIESTARGESAKQDESAINDDEEIVVLEDKAVEPYMEHRESITSMSSIQEEETLASEQSTIRSRSDSSGTLSSNGSAQVDWDELEKSEEQAPRDEGSDEVGVLQEPLLEIWTSF